MDDDTLTKAIIGTIGDVDAYQLPDAKGYSRYVGGWFCCSWNYLFSFFLWLFSSLVFLLSSKFQAKLRAIFGPYFTLNHLNICVVDL